MLRAREILEDITASTYPHTKPDFQRKKHKEIYKEAYPSNFDSEQKPLTLEQLAKVIANGR